MNKKLAHTIAFLLDLLCLVGLWMGYDEFRRILLEINNQADMIQFGNRVGFFILAIGFPLIHLLSVIDFFWPSLPKKFNIVVNRALIIMVIALLGTGFFGSSWIKGRVENAGYIYCRNASGISALARTLVYTKNMDICEELVETKRKQQK
jgi:hypothetical protein